MKIIFLDSGLKGISNFTRLVPGLLKTLPGVEIKLIFNDSWRGHVTEPVVNLPGFRGYDISTYGTNSYYRVLKREKPDLVVTLNNYFLLDKAINVICRKLKIPVVYLSHGRLSGREMAMSLPSYKRDMKKPPKINKDNFLILSNYLKSTLLRGKPWMFFSSLWALATKPGTMLATSLYNEELKVDKNLVYFNSCKDIMVKERGFPADNIHVVGNPEFDSFHNSSVAPIKSIYPNLREGQKYILYLEDGFLQNGIMNKEQWMKHLAEINESVKATGNKLAIKFHPRTDIVPLKDFLEEEDIDFFGKEADMKSLISHSEGVISVFSTTITFALIMGKNVWSPRWDATEKIAKNYPENVIRYVYSPEELKRAITGGETTNRNENYLQQEVGTPDGQSINRIVKHLCSIIPA